MSLVCFQSSTIVSVIACFTGMLLPACMPNSYIGFNVWPAFYLKAPPTICYMVLVVAYCRRVYSFRFHPGFPLAVAQTANAADNIGQTSDAWFECFISGYYPFFFQSLA